MRGHDQAGRGGGGDVGGGGSGVGSPPEIARFLRAHQPFHALDPRDVARVAAAAELESFSTGATIFSQGAEPVRHLRVVRSGAVEIVAEGRVLDRLGVGEMFGHASMLSGLPTGFAARAAEATTCYRVGMELASELLAAPEGLRYVARSLLVAPTDLHVLAREAGSNAADEPVATLLRLPALVCAPETTIREAARRMSDAATNAIVVVLDPAHPAEGLGILTDRDLRIRVVAAGLDGDAPVSVAMSAPAYTCAPDRPAGDVLLEMLDRGLRHLPVVAATGELLGVIEDMDLVAARTRSSFYLRQRIAAAASPAELVEVARELGPMVVSLHDAHVAAANVMAVYAVCVDALTRRLLELGSGSAQDVEFAWLAMGSQARREALPSSDLDSAIVFFCDDDSAREGLVAVGREVLGHLRACGLRLDEHGVNASSPAFVRSVASWRQEARGWLTDPTQEKALVLSSVVVDSRPVWGVHTAGVGGNISDTLALARWAAMSAGVTSASTPERLRSASAAGTLGAADAHTLSDAFALINDLRLDHQVAQLRDGVAPDDHIAPDELSALMRTQLREAFRAVSDIQKRVTVQLRVGVR